MGQKESYFNQFPPPMTQLPKVFNIGLGKFMFGYKTEIKTPLFVHCFHINIWNINTLSEHKQDLEHIYINIEHIYVNIGEHNVCILKALHAESWRK